MEEYNDQVTKFMVVEHMGCKRGFIRNTTDCTLSKHKNTIFTIFIAFIFLSIIIPTANPYVPHTIFGYAYYGGGVPALNASVDVTNVDTGEAITDITETGIDGAYQFDIGSPGIGWDDGQLIRIEIHDNDGNSGSATLTINLGEPYQSVQDIYLGQELRIIINQPSGDILSGQELIKGEAMGIHQIKKVEVRIDGWEWEIAAGTTNWSYSWNTTMATNGNHTVYARAYDGERYSDIVFVNVEVENLPLNHKPNVSIIFPEDGMNVRKVFTIHGIASDENGNETIQKIEIKIGNGNWTAVNGTTSWSYTWNSTDVDNGNYTIQARSYDGENYSIIDSITVKVSNEKESNRTPGFELLLLLIALAAIGFMRRRI